MQKKIFLALFFTSFLLSMLVIFIVYYFSVNQLENETKERYYSATKILAETLYQIEPFIETSSYNALRSIYEIDKKEGLLSESNLKIYAKKLGVTHFYITNEHGRFIRSTETSLDVLEKGLFDFCSEYEDQILKKGMAVKTPILPSYPYKGPYKFFMIANWNKKRILEVGVHLEVIGKILANALSSDPNIFSIGLYSPNGNQLGLMNQNKKIMLDSNTYIKNTDWEGVRYEDNRFIAQTKVDTTTKKCCECKVKNVTNSASDYYYILRAEILPTSMANRKHKILVELGILLIISALIAWFCSKKLSKNLAFRLVRLKESIKKSMDQGIMKLDITDQHQDEISELTTSMKSLLSTLEAHQQALLKSERDKTFMETAHQVSHDIRSPLAALDTLMELIGQLIPEELRGLMRASITRIRDIANNLLHLKMHKRLSNHAENSNFNYSATSVESPHKNVNSVELVSTILDTIISEKRMQFKNNSHINFELDINPAALRSFSLIHISEFKRCLSNLLNNAVESHESNIGTITLRLNLANIHSANPLLEILIIDQGKGIPDAIISNLGNKGFSHGKEHQMDAGSGIGLYHAKETMNRFNGTITFLPNIPQGTIVKLTLPIAQAPRWFAKEINIHSQSLLIIFDDDDSIHKIWQARFKNCNIQLEHLYTLDEVNKKFEKFSRSNNFLCLFDYEILGQEINGLDLIEKWQLMNHSILVTSHFEETHIRWRCEKIKVQMFPKGMAGSIPIIIK